MKKVLTILAAVCCISTAFAQDIKIKKGEIQIDKQPVAKIEKKDDYNLIYNLTGAPSYKATIKNVTPKGRETSQKWIELVNSENKVQETELELKSFNVNMQKRLVENLVQKGYITQNGIDESRYSLQDTSITDELDRILDQFETLYANEDKKASEANLLLGKSADGFYPITADFVLIGYMPRPSKQRKTDFGIFCL